MKLRNIISLKATAHKLGYDCIDWCHILIQEDDGWIKKKKRKENNC